MGEHRRLPKSPPTRKRKPGPSRDVVLDTNVVTALIQDGTCRAEFYAHAEKRGLRVVIPVVVFSEYITRREAVRAEQAVRELAPLFTEHPTHVGDDLGAILFAEENERLDATPTLLLDGVFEVLAHTTASDEEYAPLLLKLDNYLEKDGWLDRDRKARDVFAVRFRDATAADLERALEPFRERALRQYFFQVATRHRTHRRAVRANPSRYPAMVMIGSMAYLIAMGVCFAKIGFGQYQGMLSGPQKGDWVDARIAASAAYAAWLLTNDKRMTARVRHVTEAFGFGPRVGTLDEFLAKAFEDDSIEPAVVATEKPYEA